MEAECDLCSKTEINSHSPVVCVARGNYLDHSLLYLFPLSSHSLPLSFFCLAVVNLFFSSAHNLYLCTGNKEKVKCASGKVAFRACDKVLLYVSFDCSLPPPVKGEVGGGEEILDL